MVKTPFTRRSVIGSMAAIPVVAFISTSMSRADLRAALPQLDAGLPMLPAVAEFTPGPRKARITPATKIVVVTDGASAEAAAALRITAELLADDLAALTGLRRPQVRTGQPTPHDVGLRLGGAGDNPEAYTLVTDKATTIAGTGLAGVYWGTQTLLQLVRRAQRSAAGPRSVELSAAIVDAPAYGERAVMIDCARKYYSPETLKKLIRQMSYLKLNTLQMHINESEGFRVESKLFPQIVSEQHLTQDEVRDIIAYATQRSVRIILDIDSPAHFRHILDVYPQWRLRLSNGHLATSKIDFSIDEAREFVKALLGEMIDLFDTDIVHIGGDEYLPAPWEMWGESAVTDARAPQLVSWARTQLNNQSATLHDAYVLYMNEIGDFVRSKGKTVRQWNDDVYPGQGLVEIDKRTQLDVWIRWNTSKPTALDYINAGYDVMNANGDYLYFILTSDGVGAGPYKHPQGIYERWHARRFMGAAGSAGDFDLPAQYPMLGAHLSIWADNADALTQDEVLENFQEWMQTFSQHLWGTPKPVPTLPELRDEVLSVVGTAP